MITDFPCWVDVEIARFQKYKKNEKNQNLQKQEKKRKGKIEGLVWKPSKIFVKMKGRNWHGEKILFTGEGGQKNPKPKYFSFFASRLPHFAKRESKPEPHFL